MCIPFSFRRLPWWTEFKGCPVLTATKPPLFSYHFNFVLLMLLGRGLLWSIVAMQSTALNVILFLGACCNCVVLLTCFEDHICRCRQGVLGHLVPKVFECVNEIGFCSLLELIMRSLILGYQRSKICCSVLDGLARLDNSFPYC